MAVTTHRAVGRIPAQKARDGSQDGKDGSMMERRTNVWVWGGVGAACLAVLFYVIQAFGMQSWYAPIDFVSDQWFLVLPLIVGFGVQAGLFRAIHLLMVRGGGGAMTASGGVSGGGMVACCLHNLIPLFPVLGTSGLAAFFSAYQTQVFIISILVTASGVAFMIGKYRTALASSRARDDHRL